LSAKLVPGGQCDGSVRPYSRLSRPHEKLSKTVTVLQVPVSSTAWLRFGNVRDFVQYGYSNKRLHDDTCQSILTSPLYRKPDNHFT
jgi:hypothetical protein